MKRFNGKVALITGAGSGIGRAIAERYGSEGGQVVIAEIAEDNGRSAAEAVTAAGGKGLFVHTDASHKDSLLKALQTCIDEFGRIDCVVSNAWGEGEPLRFEWISDDEMQQALNLGMLSGFWLMQAAYPHMRRQGGGSIISICSLNGVNAHMYSAFYNAAKEGLRSLTRTAAREWSKYQIRANIICPAAATTAYQRFAEQQPENAKALAAQNPMGRIGDPLLDIAGVACFLASDDARYVTGNTLFVDGGSHINGVSWAPDLPEQRSDS